MNTSRFKVLDRSTNTHKILNSFQELVSYKGLNPKTAGKPRKRAIRNLATIYSFPSLTEIAIKANFKGLLDENASSKRLTKEYVNDFLTRNHLVTDKPSKPSRERG